MSVTALLKDIWGSPRVVKLTGDRGSFCPMEVGGGVLVGSLVLRFVATRTQGFASSPFLEMKENSAFLGRSVKPSL